MLQAPPPRRARPSAWRRTATALAVLGLAPLSACDPDPATPCTAAYEHLLTLGRRNHDPDLQLRFVKACAESFDAARVACLRAAESPEEALSCESTKKRPG